MGYLTGASTELETLGDLLLGLAEATGGVYGYADSKRKLDQDSRDVGGLRGESIRADRDLLLAAVAAYGEAVRRRSGGTWTQAQVPVAASQWSVAPGSPGRGGESR